MRNNDSALPIINGVTIVSVCLVGINFLFFIVTVHAANCMDISSAGLIEAMEQETRILEKRIIACRNHVMLVTSLL